MDRIAEWDVIIVGGGPGGSTAGYILSNFGFRVIIIDKSYFPREKLCGGLITYKTLTLLNRVFNETRFSLKKRAILDSCSNYYEIFYKKKFLVRNRTHIPFYFVNRKKYDAFLLEKTMKKGVKVIEGEEVKFIDISDSSVTTSSGKKFRAKFIIGADGVNSIIRRSVFKGKIDTSAWNNNLSTSIEIFVDRSQVEKNINDPIIYFGFVNWGYSWIFPNKDKLLVGLGGLNKVNGNNFLNLFYKFINSSLNLDREKIKIIGYPVPYGNFLLTPIYKNFLLIGDAAGFVDPITGEGIFYAQRSAELAAWSIYNNLHNGKSIEISYLQLLEKYIYPELISAKRKRQLLFNFLAKFHYYPLKIILKILNKQLIEVVHGIRSYKKLKRKGKKYEI